MADKVPGTLSGLEIGDTAVVTEVGGEGALRQHFLDMGVIPGARMTLVKYAPLGDPMEFLVHGYALTLRVDEASRIACEPAQPRDHREPVVPAVATEHPGLGEGGRFHVKATEHPLPEGTTLTFALAGNQNCGKT
ncbi:MAG: ferrous iron transport protein A, partial [Olsenella sp.]|nr:ferrous iron transport protein A [Olsenella sp.]